MAVNAAIAMPKVIKGFLFIPPIRTADLNRQLLPETYRHIALGNAPFTLRGRKARALVKIRNPRGIFQRFSHIRLSIAEADPALHQIEWTH